MFHCQKTRNDLKTLPPVRNVMFIVCFCPPFQCKFMKQKIFLSKSSLTAALAGFLFGFCTVVISGAEQTIQSLRHLNSTLYVIAVCMAL